MDQRDFLPGRHARHPRIPNVSYDGYTVARESVVAARVALGPLR